MPFLSRGGDVCIAFILKCGCRSISQWVHNYSIRQELTNEEALKIETRVAFVRDPIDRLKSVFFDARWSVRIGNNWDNIPNDILLTENRGIQGDWQSFVDYSLETDNRHWRPQTDLISHNGQLVPNVYHMLKDIKQYYHLYFKEGSLPHTGAAARVEQPEYNYRVDDLNEKYKADIELFNSIDGTLRT